MAKDIEGKGKGMDSTSRQDEVVKAVTEDRGGIVWIREDGAICIGNECVVIKPEPGTRNLDIEIAPTKCGANVGEVIVDHLLKTVGKGGNTRFTVKSELQQEGK